MFDSESCSTPTDVKIRLLWRGKEQFYIFYSFRRFVIGQETHPTSPASQMQV